MSAFALLLWSCGPDKPRTCQGDDPKFKVLIRLGARPLPSDTVVHVTYAGSAKEAFRLSDPKAQLDVTFCQAVNLDGTPFDSSRPAETGLDGAVGAAGAAGAEGTAGAAGTTGAAGAAGAPAAPNDHSVPALYCQLFTAGFTELEISGSGFMTVDYELTPNKEHCVLEKEFVLDAPDAGD